jgi:hypothetical protein
MKKRSAEYMERERLRNAARRSAGLVQQAQREWRARNKEKCKSYSAHYHATRMTPRREKQLGAVWWKHVEKEQRALAAIDACWGKTPRGKKAQPTKEEQSEFNRQLYLERKKDSVWYAKALESSRKSAFKRYYKMREDPAFKMKLVCRNAVSRICRTVGSRRAKRARTSEYLGCSFDFARSYIEQRFREGMTWENHGTVWHVDHVIPLASFDFTSDAQIRKAMHYTNLQPLFAHENRTKQDKQPTQLAFL